MSQPYTALSGHIPPQPARHVSRPSSEEDLTMLAEQSLRLPLPRNLDFGDDPRPGFTDPRKYGSVGNGRRGQLPTRSVSTHEKLPSVNQLLSAGTRSSYSVSSLPSLVRPFSGGFAAPTSAPEPYPNREAVTSTYRPFQSGSYHSSYQSVPHPQEVPPSTLQPRIEAISYSPLYHQSNQRDGHPMAMPPLNSPKPNAAPPAEASSGAWYRSQHPPQTPPEVQTPLRRSSTSESRDMSKPVAKLLGEQVFPGEGVCYVYDNGSHVRKVIDGETVNAQWGITKAGKPRKRLAIACITCREKKIKCDPSEPKCVQCEKSGRECRFQTA